MFLELRRRKLRRTTFFLFLLVVFTLCAHLGFAQEPGKVSPAESGVSMLWRVKIPLRDGIKLNATIFQPKGISEPLPSIFTLTPYISDTYIDRALYFAQHGYVFAAVDVRGRGNSEGQFEPFAQEGRDGYDIVEWLALQPWCNGKVTMWGGSYAGFDQWSTLKEFPPHLATIVPAAAAHPGVDFPFYNGIFTSYTMQWLTYTSGVTPNVRLFGNSPFWIEKFIDLYRDHRAFKELDRVVGNPSLIFQKWLSHPFLVSYYDAMVPTAEDYQKIKIPILSITGHYDGDQAGALTYYRNHQKFGDPAAVANHYLIIGPWDHAGTRTPNRDVGGLRFGEASLVDLNRLHLEWYDWTMKGGKKPEFLKNRVAYYVVGPGAELWRYADDLALIAPEKLVLYAHSPGSANDVFSSGTLQMAKPDKEKPDKFTYDPLDTRPAELEKEEVLRYITDQRFVLNLFGNGLVYHSEPFVEPIEITGQVKFVAWISMDVPDTDLQAALYEVLPDGTSVALTQDMKRVRYRESLRQEKMATPGEIMRLEFDSFTFFSRRISKGSRLRLLLSCLNTPSLEKNYNSGGVVAGETGADARTAHITFYHDVRYPSHLEIPVSAVRR